MTERQRQRQSRGDKTQQHKQLQPQRINCTAESESQVSVPDVGAESRVLNRQCRVFNKSLLSSLDDGEGDAEPWVLQGYLLGVDVSDLQSDVELH